MGRSILLAWHTRVSRFSFGSAGGPGLEQRPPICPANPSSLCLICVAQMIVGIGVRARELMISSELAGKPEFYSRAPKIVEKDRGLIDRAAQLDEGGKALVGKATQ